MEKRRYKNTDEFISLLGFGNMRLPLKEGGTSKDIDVKRAEEMIDYAYAQGVNYFDTAYMYHEGASETFIGQALSKYDRKSFNLATKMPLVFVKEQGDVDKFFNEQLAKCKVDYFDFYLLHNINRANQSVNEQFKVYEYLNKKKQEGYIRHLGFSFHDTPDVLSRVVNAYDWDFTQIQLNYMDWDLQQAEKQHAILKNAGIPIVVMEPVRGGALATLCEKSVEIFKKADPKSSVASWSLRFAASIPEVLVVLSGMSAIEQVKDNIATIQNFKPIGEPEQKVIDQALAAYRASGTIPCTACRYCMDCPEGVDIPRVLAVYNNFRISQAGNPNPPKFFFDMQYNVLGEEKFASHCIKCGKCATKCPQHIEIPHWMEVIDTYHKSGKLPA
jgi:predicted aldo/keto reductase-like oxidoreductase